MSQQTTTAEIAPWNDGVYGEPSPAAKAIWRPNPWALPTVGAIAALGAAMMIYKHRAAIGQVFKRPLKKKVADQDDEKIAA